VSFISYAAREINCKIVYCGPGLSGKTANLRWIFDQTLGKTGGQLTALATETDRTVFFDYLVFDLGSLQGFKTRFHLYTVPGRVSFEASRRSILRGADGVILVADSQAERRDANLEAVDDLMGNLQQHGLELIPYVIQLNKRDLPNVLPVETLKKELMRKDEPVLEAIAYRGVGVFEALKTCGRMVLSALKKDQQNF